MTRQARVGSGRRYLSAGVFGLCLCITAAFIGARDAELFEWIEGAFLDWRFQLRGPGNPAGDTTIVAIDDTTLEAAGHWPLPRRTIAAALRRLGEDGARLVAFDLLFLGKGAVDHRRSNEPADDDDVALVEAMARSSAIVIPYAFLFGAAPANPQPVPDPIVRSAYRIYSLKGGKRPNLLFHPTGLAAPSERLLAAGTPGHVNIFYDGDGKLRYAYPVIGYGGDYFPSLAVETARLALGLNPGDMAVEFETGLRLGGRRIPADHHMRMAVNYRGPAGSFPRYSFGDLLAGRIPEGTFANTVVLVGSTAIGTGDAFPSPFDDALPGVEYLATVIDNLRQGDPLDRSPQALVVDIAILLGLALLFAGLSTLRQPIVTLIAGIAIGVVLGIGNFLAFSLANLWLNLTFPLLAVLLSTGLLGFANMMSVHKERARALRQRDDLSQYVSPWIAERVARGEQSSEFPKTLQAAILFVDMRGFTALSEARGGTETARLLHAYHEVVEKTVVRHRGTIDKFMGDGAMAVFGIPEPDPIDPFNAFVCARDLAQQLAGWAGESNRERAETPMAFGIGVHYGPVVVDQTGGQRQLHLNVSGDTVNVASRLESLTTTHGAAVIASDAIVEVVRAQGAGELVAEFVKLPMQSVKGRDRPVGAWALPYKP